MTRVVEEGKDTRGHWRDDPRANEFGPQGAALILELQRLWQAFEAENTDARKPRAPKRRGAEQPKRRRAPPPKRRRKSRVGKVIDVCLQQFGLKAPAEPAERRNPPPLDIERPPPRRASPTIAPDNLLAMDLTKLAPEIAGPFDLGPSIGLESPDSAQPRPAKPGTAVAKLVETCRSGVMAGVNFIVNSNGEAPPADGSLTVKASWSYERELRTGLRILLVAGVLGGGWFFLMPLAGAVVVPGNLVVQSNVKTIQHPTGGVVAEIAVQNGSHVKAGDLLVRLDATQAQASLEMVNKQLDEMRAKIARLTAERDDRAQIEIPPELSSRAGDETVKSLLASEESLFKARSSARHSQKDLLQSKVGQLTQEISGLQVQVDSRAKQFELIQGELAGVQDLYDKRLVPITRLTTLQREAARIDGERGQLTASIAETKSKIGEAQLQIVRIDQDFRTEVVKDLGDAEAKEAELVERSVAARDQLDRIEIRAPTSGVILQLAAHTIGGVIKAGETIMEIVPDSDDLQVEARLPPQDIDHVHAGQKAFVRFSAFNQRTTPQLTGTVSYVSADTSHDQQTNTSFFTVRVTLPEDERRRLAGQQLVPGMPAEVFMQTGSRTMASYVFKPIAEQMRRAFVEP
ncbi:MAG TPA: HlyD family type I secretion periplasmic adaptor subunit [Bradyrhizobium sp.]|uniref:HlyD family type I secretion periplasmic adaptor subunit n=1 Tax=Bradyrhizobium sp. TaxID=376 RepID=UPI002C894CF4|nr:HlyD family type I secretion periplasmic adaptor subunit [Bradyrhizobium sp.]HLZ00547.1 HlyD family type I secretion periplasmic adaptor subunit [Bradyrhizobium sp.]